MGEAWLTSGWRVLLWRERQVDCRGGVDRMTWEKKVFDQAKACICGVLAVKKPSTLRCAYPLLTLTAERSKWCHCHVTGQMAGSGRRWQVVLEAEAGRSPWHSAFLPDPCPWICRIPPPPKCPPSLSCFPSQMGKGCQRDGTWLSTVHAGSARLKSSGLPGMTFLTSMAV